MLQGPGENAGVIDLGDGEAVAFKVESHNHPSAVEPFQGAATGVGGILRDIVAMGARPVALLDGLRFGARRRPLLARRGGIGHYGNCVGRADRRRRDGLRPGVREQLPRQRDVRRPAAIRAGNARASDDSGLALVLFGATTGRDGIGGASVLASQELGDDAPEKRPSVQIGDPFTGKRLIEVSLELVERGLVESLQDCGAAGLASALAEMARDGAGVDVHLDRVPLREKGLEPWEIMISESQERMVAAVQSDALEAVAEVIDRWELHWAEIGVVTDTGLLQAFHDGTLEGEMRASFLTDECPRYEVERRPRDTDSSVFAHVVDPRQVYEHYDQLVGSRTVRRPGLDAAVLRLTPSYRGLAVSLDGPPLGERDPFLAGARATLEAARNVACAGGEPLGLTDCLNFGNPEKPEIGWELAEAIEGIAAGGRGARHPRRLRQRLALQRDGRAARSCPRRSSVASGSWPTFGRCRAAGGRVTSFCATTRERFDIAAEAALVSFLWRAAPHCSLVHDISGLGPYLAVEHAARWSGVGRRRGHPRERFRDPRVLARRRWQTAERRAGGDRDGRLMCGVFGIYAPDRDVARLTHFALHALQHRGQEAAGIAVSENGRLTVLQELGLITNFSEQKLRGLRGEAAIGHTRYSTTGSSTWANAQPLLPRGKRSVALAHNGNLVNANELRERARGRRREAQLDVRLRADRRRDRRRPAATRGGRARGDGEARGRVLRRRDR